MNLNRRRLQVFVSSTYSDLVEERQAALEAILTSGHIPAGMELFSPQHKLPMDVVQQWIDDSDVFLLILGRKTGAMDAASRLSDMRQEYKYALAQGKPTFACVMKAGMPAANVSVSKDLICTHTEVVEKRREFRNLFASDRVRLCADCKDIKIAVGETLSRFTRNKELVGWVRAGDVVDAPALAGELARLSRENDQLRKSMGDKVEFHGLTHSQTVALLRSKDLLEFLLANCQKLAVSLDGRPPKVRIPCEHLCRVGLVEHLGRAMFRLTDAGRTFLNQYEVASSKRSPKSKAGQAA